MEFPTLDLPAPDPLPEAVHSGVFGWTEAGAVEPDEQAVRSLMAEQAQELLVYLSERQWLRYCLDEGRYPHSGKRPSQTSRTESLRQQIGEMLLDNHRQYEDCLAAYETGFGEAAARELDHFVQQHVPEAPPRQHRLF